MNSDTLAPAPGTPAASVYGARVIAVVALLIGIVQVGVSVLIAVDTSHTTGDAAMFSFFGYVLAGMIGVPGAIAVVLAGGSLVIQRNVTAAYVTASAAALAVLLPILLFLVQYR